MLFAFTENTQKKMLAEVQQLKLQLMQGPFETQIAKLRQYFHQSHPIDKPERSKAWKTILVP